jgi:two-component system phosphate regulon response regulator OmpR
MTPADDLRHILVVDDDRRLRDLLARFLRGEGFAVSTAADTGEADAKLKGIVFDLLVLDVMMPGESGFDFARRLRRDTNVPILMLTARAEASDRIRGLEIGVDDYLAKPFEPRELVLRINSILRRAASVPISEKPTIEVVRFGDFLFRVDRAELRRGESPIRLTEREREILSLLAKRANESVPREELAGYESGANERTIDVQINRLRRKIETDAGNPIHLQTVRGVGYRLVVDG